MTDLTLLGIAEAGRLMARGEITSTQLTEAFLKRIEAVDHKIASYITVTADLARNAARQADMEMKGGLRRGPMHGIPVALKDIYETAGVHDDRPFASQEGLCAGDRRRDGAAPERWRRRHPGQARHARVRQRRDDAGPAVPGRAQSLEHRVPARRLVERLGCGGRGPALHGRDGLRHRRLDPQSGRLLRHRRHQADLRAGQPLRHLPAQLQLRHGRAARLDDGRLRADARCAGGLRPQRPGLGARRRRSITARRPIGRSRACASRWRAAGTKARTPSRPR